VFRNIPKSLIYLLLILLSFYFFFVRPYSFTSLKFKFIEVASGPIRLLSYPLFEIKKMLFYHRIFDEYKQLSMETNVLKARLVGLEEVMRENTRLERLLEFKRSLIYSSVAANVIGRDPSYWNSGMIIDKGKQDGIEVGMPVVNASGVVGKIAEVSKKKAKVILLTDPQFSVAALIQVPRESGLVSGTLQGICRMRYLKDGSKIRVGDMVVTSKLSSSFPESLPIGEIIRIEEDPGRGSVECIIQPTVSISQVEEVLVILK